MVVLIVSFFITAILYATVGLGGGSTYGALLVLAETDYHILPTIALICNIIVASGGAYRFLRAGHINARLILPLVFTSIPAAWLGGYIHVSESWFSGLLGFSLLVAGGRMLWQRSASQNIFVGTKVQPFLLAPAIGAGLGFLSGIVGIGGGIFLAPVLHLLRWDNAKKIAATCSVFILTNSLAGLSGQVMKLHDTELLDNIGVYGWLFPAVLVGGQIGSYMGAKYLNPNTLRFLTALLILYVSGRLLLRWWGMI